MYYGNAMLSFAIVSCKTDTISADQTAGALYNLYVLSNGDECKKLGITDEEIQQVLDTQKSESIKATRLNFTKGGLPITNAELEEIYKAQLEALKKLTPTIKIESEDKDKVVVKISTTYIDLIGADTKAAEEAISEATKSGKTSKSDISKIYIKHLIENIKGIKNHHQILKKILFEFKKTKYRN